MSFAKTLRLDARTLTWISIAILVVATMLPALLNNNQAHAAQIDNRSITMSTSEASVTDVEYTVSFDTGSAGNVESLVLQFCDDSPIIGDTCAVTRSTLGAGDFDWQDATLTVNGQVGIVDWSVNTTNSTATKLILDRAGPADPGAGTTISFTLGSSSADGVDNPDIDNSAFYVRVLTYATAAAAVTYTAGTPGANVDDGGIALSTASQITINARVQERLTFCVGTADPTANCGAVSGSTIDLGVLDDTSINKASNAFDGPGAEAAYLQITTNAANGATISYFGDNLKVSGATCGAIVNDDLTTADVTDQCINYDDDPDTGTTQDTMVIGTELWGFGISAVTDDASGATSNLVGDTIYNMDNNDGGEGGVAYTTAANEHAFDANTTTQLADTSGTVAASEQLTLDFGATAQITTPTGLYSTTLTFIATSTF